MPTPIPCRQGSILHIVRAWIARPPGSNFQIELDGACQLFRKSILRMSAFAPNALRGKGGEFIHMRDSGFGNDNEIIL